MNFDKIEGIINRIAIKHRIGPDKVKNIIRHVFFFIRTKLVDKSYPKILIHNFGTFRPSVKLLKARIKRYKEAGRETGELEEALKRIENERL